MIWSRGKRLYVQREYPKRVQLAARALLVSTAPGVTVLSMLFPQWFASPVPPLEGLLMLAFFAPMVAMLWGGRGPEAVYEEGFYPEFSHTARQVRQGGSRWVPWKDVKHVHQGRLFGTPTLRVVVSPREVYYWKLDAKRKNHDEAMVAALISSWIAYGGKLEPEEAREAAQEE